MSEKIDLGDDMEASVRDIIENTASATLATVAVFLVERLEQGATLEEVIPEIAAQVRDTKPYLNYKKAGK